MLIDTSNCCGIFSSDVSGAQLVESVDVLLSYVYMCMCVYVYVYMCMCICVYVYMYMCICVYVYPVGHSTVDNTSLNSE